MVNKVGMPIPVHIIPHHHIGIGTFRAVQELVVSHLIVLAYLSSVTESATEGTSNDQQHLHVQTDSYHSEPLPGGYFPDRSVVSHSREPPHYLAHLLFPVTETTTEAMTNHYQQNSHAQNSPYPSAPVRGGRYLKDDLRPASNGCELLHYVLD